MFLPSDFETNSNSRSSPEHNVYPENAQINESRSALTVESIPEGLSIDRLKQKLFESRFRHATDARKMDQNRHEFAKYEAKLVEENRRLAEELCQVRLEVDLGRDALSRIENSMARESETPRSATSATASSEWQLARRIGHIEMSLERERNDNTNKQTQLKATSQSAQHETEVIKQQYEAQNQMISWLQGQLEEKSAENKELREKWELCLAENVELKSELINAEETRKESQSVRSSIDNLSTPEMTPIKQNNMNNRVEVNALVEELRDLKSIISSNHSEYGGP